MGDRNGQRRPDAYERPPAGSDLCHISLNVSGIQEMATARSRHLIQHVMGTLWRLLPLRPTTTLSRLRPLGSWKPLAASATASCHHHVPTTSTRELAALVMMPSRLTADRNIQVALKFYPSHATYSGQASYRGRIEVGPDQDPRRFQEPDIPQKRRFTASNNPKPNLHLTPQNPLPAAKPKNSQDQPQKSEPSKKELRAKYAPKSRICS
nr:uncharacterized protein LOC129385912 [Dermacentor andersoni]